MSNKRGVLLMAYGTPGSLDDVEAYYTHIRHGHKPSEELLAQLKQRYALVGGQTPLSEISEATRAALERLLNENGDNYRVVLGMKHWKPWIADAVKVLATAGIQEALGLVLAPHYSSMSIGDYYERVDQAQRELGTDIQVERIDSWHLHRPYLEAVARRTRARLAEFEGPADVVVIFTAHSLPQKILERGDPYPEQLRETSAALADQLDLSAGNWTFAYQSAGRTADPWLGPDIVDTIHQLADRGVKNILVVPIGFVSDHLEIFYDIDVEAQGAARDRGVRLKRIESLNAGPDFIEALADLIHVTEARAGSLQGTKM